MKPGFKFKVIFSHDVDCFLYSLPSSAKNKILYNIDKVSNGLIDNELFKKLDNSDIWEFRTLYEGMAYRLMAFWDTEEDTLVITTHGFIKKTQKTPRKEITRAQKIRNQYFETKNNKTWKK